MVHGLETMARLNKEEVEKSNATDCSKPDLIDGDYSRENLIRICEAAVVSVNEWRNRDSPSSQEKVGLCWAMLRAGCDFKVTTEGSGGCVTNDKTIWLEMDWPSFNTFEYGHGEYHREETFYLPTPERLRVSSGDWY